MISDGSVPARFLDIAQRFGLLAFLLDFSHMLLALENPFWRELFFVCFLFFVFFNKCISQ